MEATLGTKRTGPQSWRNWWARLRATLTLRRLVFGFAICLLLSTAVLFQPHFYRLFILESLVRAWLDYLGECLLMGAPVILALTIAEVVSFGRSQAITIAIALVALLAGTVVGATLLIAYYDLGWSEWGGRDFLGDVLYWTLIGSGVAVIYGFQQSAAAAAAALHRTQVDQMAVARQVMETRLQVMRAQIEPHFLFNTLANVKRLCQTDVTGGVAMLDNLILYLRAALPRMRDEQSTLGQEGELVRAYLAVLKIRMGSRLQYLVDVPDALAAHPFPPMVLLTLAENALKHGLTPAGGGMISVRAEVVGHRLQVRVADNGVGFGAAATGGTGVGLANTRARLSAMHGPTAELSFLASEPTGVVAVIEVPLLSLPLDAPVGAAAA